MLGHLRQSRCRSGRGIYSSSAPYPGIRLGYVRGLMHAARGLLTVDVWKGFVNREFVRADVTSCVRALGLNPRNVLRNNIGQEPTSVLGDSGRLGWSRGEKTQMRQRRRKLDAAGRDRTGWALCGSHWRLRRGSLRSWASRQRGHRMRWIAAMSAGGE